MDTSNIPKTFWHALSICMMAATFGIIFIAYRSSTVSIEIANAKINLSSALATVKDIKGDLEAENERLKKVNEELQAKLQSADSDVAKVIRDPGIGVDLKEILKGIPLGGDNSVVRRVDPRLFEDLGTKIQQVEKAVQQK
ncbi:hypothetical protein E0E52_08675 [Azotobacter chroococcum]|uniref:hypothetical protein n=1 Tax=Azotobacter chroococcum TaxID=353 RepID=UPI00103FC58E|nr:hypothetical protein [Azotobacter chroococcum]TBW08562.1 hypothetical protein E0E52_08675 [Azotobacter chroococcum]